MWFGIFISIVSFWTQEIGRDTISRRVNLAGAALYPLPIIGVAFYIWLTVQSVPPLF